jgi:DnaJ-class molecular chaperone
MQVPQEDCSRCDGKGERRILGVGPMVTCDACGGCGKVDAEEAEEYYERMAEF